VTQEAQQTQQTQRILELPEVDLVYDVYGPLPTADGRPPLVMVGQPMDASGFQAQVKLFDDRTVVTYDPRGLGRSKRKDGGVTNEPQVQAEDIHAIIEELGGGPVDMLASSGGAVSALALVTAYPNDVATLVAHEPPIDSVLPDAQAVQQARDVYTQIYRDKGWGAGMAGFIAMTSWEGEITEEFLAQPAPDPAAFGMPADDDGTRDDPLLSDRSWAVPLYQPNFEALKAAPTRIVVAVGEESVNVYTGRAAIALAKQLGQEATVFPSHHGGFMGGEFGYAGQPEAFAAKLREVLDAA
jgi:pimeloyl-ACP methyl ester carboxylesterase